MLRDAILVGDALASLSLNLAADYDRDIVKVVSQACLLLCDGEYIDSLTASTELSERDYFEKIMKKSASLFSAATLCGSIAGSGSKLENDSLAEFGENFGIAYQIKDDLSDITSLRDGSTPNLNDLQTLPIIHINNAGNSSQKKLLQSFLSQKAENGSEGKISPEKIYECLENAGSIAYCNDKINSYLNKAVASLEPLRQSIYKSYLTRMAESMKMP